jgi:hypothetical protein
MASSAQIRRHDVRDHHGPARGQPLPHCDRERLRELGRTMLWEGAQDIVFEAA